MAAIWKYCIYLFIAISLHYCKATSYPVPLFIWSTKSVDIGEQILAGHTLDYEDVQVKYLDKLKTHSKTFCLFIQDKLSIDDFAANPGMDLKHLKDVLHSSATSVVLPSVSLNQDNDEDEKNNKLVADLENSLHGAVIPLTPRDVADLPNRINTLKTDMPSVFIVHLPKATIGDDLTRNLEPSDEIIGKVSEVLSSHFPDHVALLTADMPRDDVQNAMADARQLSVSHSRERRSFEDDDSPLPCGLSGILVAKENTAMYISKMNIYEKNVKLDALKNISKKVPASDITIHNSSGLMLQFPLKDVLVNGSEITMKISFNKSGIRWWCLSIGISGTINGSHVDTSHNCSNEINVPIYKSFACEVSLNFTQVIFEGIQVQPYDARNATFANSYNCVGFFTPPIWMGLISAGILVAILYGGMLALLSIKSMDRFDNPKDPPLVINSE